MNLPYFTFFDFTMLLAWLIIILACMLIYVRHHQEHAKVIYFGMGFKIFGSLLFGLVYIYFYGGGDTTAYYDGALTLNKLFLNNPGNYFEEILTTQDLKNYYNFYNAQTGYPPLWIYKEPEGFLTCKITSLFTFLTFGSYWAANMLISVLVFVVSFKLYLLILKYNFIDRALLAIAMIFLPTVAFWCSGISKDAYISIAYFYLIYKIFSWLSFSTKPKLYSWVLIFTAIIWLINIRSFMILTLALPFLISTTQIVTRKMKSNFLRIVLRSLSVIVSLISIFVFIRFSEDSLMQDYLNELETIQRDFSNNLTYGNNKYDLNIENFEIQSLILVFPQAIVASFYRPFIWEVNSAFMLLSSLEGLIFLFLTLKFFFYQSFLKKIQFIMKNEVLLFFFISILLLAFIIGISSVLFGVLVRFKAILLPFLAILLLCRYQKQEAS